MSAGTVAGIAVAGAVGAPTRYAVDRLVHRWLSELVPWGILVVNVSGSFLLGLITGAVLYHGLGATPKLWLGTGFCGAYTTFSTFTFDTVRLLEAGDKRPAVTNVVVSVVAGLLAAAAGLAVMAI